MWNGVSCAAADAQICTIWNYRREALQPVFESGGEAAATASEAELALTQVRESAPVVPAASATYMRGCGCRLTFGYLTINPEPVRDCNQLLISC